MSRKLLIPLVAAAFIAAPAFAPAPIAAGLSGSAQAKNLNTSRSNIYRTEAQSGTKKGARTTKIKSTKSNTSDRMGGGGGKGAAAPAQGGTFPFPPNCGSGDPLKGLNVSKSKKGGGGGGCAD